MSDRHGFGVVTTTSLDCCATKLECSALSSDLVPLPAGSSRLWAMQPVQLPEIDMLSIRGHFDSLRIFG